ncbi:MAG: hypothetical protein M3406_10305 [Chloroflexota bacterium]|nr:hypothetical protein [Chloroflexota bacterium]
MDAATQTQLGQILSLAGLIGATIEYAEIIKRRARILRVADRPWVAGDRSRGVGRFPNAPPRLRGTTAPRGNQLGGIGWAAIGLIALVIRGLLSAWRAVAKSRAGQER